jgi:membrane protease YdiL (CAAX protease family)
MLMQNGKPALILRGFMNPTLNCTTTQSRQLSLTLIAWAVMLAVSELGQILFRELTGAVPTWLFPAKMALLAAATIAGTVWPAVRPLRPFFIILFALYALHWAMPLVAMTPAWHNLVGRDRSSFIGGLLNAQAQRFIIAVFMVGVSWLVLRDRRAFFFAKGDQNAPAGPLKFAGVMGTSTWHKRGPLIALTLCAGLALFIVLAGGAPISNLSRALPFMPFVLLFAAMNAFGEEMIYRAPQLGALHSVVGPAQALLVTAAYFGIGHYYGVPYGVIGVAMSFVLGWILGKSMLETKGMFWAWLIHFCMDVVIFTFMAAGSVTPGG